MKTPARVAEQQLTATFVSVVAWDMPHLRIESEFAAVFPPGCYAAQAYWYTVGHVPCGCNGEFPNGIHVT